MRVSSSTFWNTPPDSATVVTPADSRSATQALTTAVPHDAVRRYKFLTLTALSRVASTVTGFVRGLPVGVTDYATSVRVHGDQVSPERHPGPALDGRSVTDVFVDAQAAAAAQGFTADDRVMSTAAWTTADELTTNLLAVFVAGASLVQVTNPDPSALDRRRQMEKVTRG